MKNINQYFFGGRGGGLKEGSKCHFLRKLQKDPSPTKTQPTVSLAAVDRKKHRLICSDEGKAIFLLDKNIGQKLPD